MERHRPLGWQPEHTWVFVVGVLRGADDRYFAPLPGANRQDAALVSFFRRQGVPRHQIVYLQDEEATTAQVERALAQQLSAARPDDLLVFYYCGHGGITDQGQIAFATYDADGVGNIGLRADTLPARIDASFGGRRALLLIDCCYSGGLAQVIGRVQRRVAFACLTSSLASEDSTGNWTFTTTLLDGLRGHAFVDANGDHHQKELLSYWHGITTARRLSALADRGSAGLPRSVDTCVRVVVEYPYDTNVLHTYHMLQVAGH